MYELCWVDRFTFIIVVLLAMDHITHNKGYEIYGDSMEIYKRISMEYMSALCPKPDRNRFTYRIQTLNQSI